MIEAQYFRLIFLLFVTISSLIVFSKYNSINCDISRAFSKQKATFVLSVILTIFIGVRPLSGKYFVDMMSYNETYNVLLEGSDFQFNFLAENLLFDNYFALIGSLNLGIEFFFLSIAAIYFGASYFGIRKLFPNDTLAAYLVFLGAFSTFSYATNGIKAGAAASLFILAIAYRENIKLCIPLVLISWGFHHSMQLPVAAFFLSLFYRNSKVYFAVWCLSILIAAAHISYFQNVFAGMSDERGEIYLTTTSDWGGKSGFRLDFVIYSAMPVLVAYWAMYKKKLNLSLLYKSLLNIYLITNSAWMQCMYAEFTNRIAYLSWFLYPILMIYPFLKEDWGTSKYKVFSKVMLAHLAFTLFMEFVYYA